MEHIPTHITNVHMSEAACGCDDVKTHTCSGRKLIYVGEATELVPHPHSHKTHIHT